ncbi:uncharacterized protein LOC143223992 [Tachypleus tridentatus]|uniref:uncharacterized protein LOC143223992 n=1 Tax=Tachypleus tridentatus TaxID=6853 RepID=UPI003FD2D0B4
MPCFIKKITLPWRLFVVYSFIFLLTEYFVQTNSLQIIPDCTALGFYNATLNNCGYCVEGTTGLSKDYGKDCNGVCGGNAIVDCTNTCGGEAYVDECTGICIGGTASITQSNVPSDQRDCRGLCIKSSPFEYKINACGICSKASEAFTLFSDCTNMCHLPGDHSPKAQMLCGQCVDGKSNVSSSDVLDECGQCKKDGRPCPVKWNISCCWAGRGQPDACGVCGDQGKTCVNLQRVYPMAAPNMTDTNVTLVGAFKGYTGNVNCVFRPYINNENMDMSLTYITGKGNGSVVSCVVKLPSGQYEVGVQLNKQDIFANNTVFLVYSNDVGYGDMIPSRSAYKNLEQQHSNGVTVTFKHGSVPNLPLYCLIAETEYSSKETVIEGNPSSPSTCVIPYPLTSQNITISPSLDGQHKLTKSFLFSFYAPPPNVRQAYISEDGSAVVVIFDCPVNVSSLQGCSSLLSSSNLQELGENSLCQWATKTQLVVFVTKQIISNSVTITLQSGIISEDDQTVYETLTSNLSFRAIKVPSGEMGKIMITGPSSIPVCGSFVLTAHYSSPKGGKASYMWNIRRFDKQNIDQKLVDSVKGQTTTHLIMESSLLETDIIYEFIVSVISPGEESIPLHVQHLVTRRPFPAPLVTVYPSSLFLLSVNKEVLLTAEASLPDCIDKSRQIHFKWTVDNPRVKYDFKSLHSPVYRVTPYTLPENQKVQLTVQCFLDGKSTEFTTSSVMLVTTPYQLKASIQGSSSRVLGTQSGILHFDGSSSSYRQLPLVYQWSCHTDDRQPCFNHKDMSNSSLLIPRDKQNQPVLEIDSQLLKSGEKLNIGLKVFTALNNSQSSEVSTVAVYVVDGNIPQVVIQSVTVNGRPVMSNFSHFSVHAGVAVKVEASVTSYKIPIYNVSWNVRAHPLTYSYSVGLIGKGHGKTELCIPEGTLVGHGLYEVTVTACNEHGGCGVNNLTLYALPSVSLCQVKVNSFTAFDWATGWVYGCSVPLDKAPLTYQLYIKSNEIWVPVTKPQLSSVLTFFGPPAYDSDISIFGAEVCDQFYYCQWFTSNPVQVEYPLNITHQVMLMMTQSEKAYASGNPLEALYEFSLAIFATEENITSEQAKTLVNYSFSAMSDTLSTGSVLIVYNSILPLLSTNNTAMRLDALMVIEHVTKKMMVKKTTHLIPTIKFMFARMTDVFQDFPGHVQLMQQFTKTLSALLKVAAVTLTRDEILELRSEHEDCPRSVLQYKVLNSSPLVIRGNLPSGEPVKVTVKFHKHVRNRFRHWSCGQWTCDGVVVTMTLYITYSPYLQDSHATRLAPVVTIEMRTPGTGIAVPISYNKIDTVLITLSKIQNESTEGRLSVECQMWDNSEEQWTPDRVISLGYSEGFYSCWSSQLSVFTILEVSNRMTISTIIGIAVASLMAVLIVGILVILFVRKKQVKVAEMTHEPLRRVCQK